MRLRVCRGLLCGVQPKTRRSARTSGVRRSGKCGISPLSCVATTISKRCGGVLSLMCYCRCAVFILAFPPLHPPRGASERRQIVTASPLPCGGTSTRRNYDAALLTGVSFLPPSPAARASGADSPLPSRTRARNTGAASLHGGHELARRW